MYCPKCGKEILQESRFCAVCGTENPNYAEAVLASTPVVGMAKRNGKTKMIVLIVAAIAAVLFAYLIFGGNGIDLKYDWGTHRSEIEENESVVEMQAYVFQDGKGISLICDDPYREVDGLKELTNSERTRYWTDNRGRLYRINYYINRDLSITERLDILCDRYGDDYYVEKNGHSNARYYTYYWWLDDTVIRLVHDSLDYYDEAYYLESESMRTTYEDLLEYFDK